MVPDETETHAPQSADNQDSGPAAAPEWLRTWVLERTLVPIVAGLAGYALVTRWPGDDSEVFRSSPQFEIWVLFVGTQFACWTAGYFFLRRWSKRVRTIAAKVLADAETMFKVVAFLTSVAVLLVLLGPLWASYARSDFLKSPLQWHEGRISLQIMFGVVAVAPGLGALAVLGYVGDRVDRHDVAADRAGLLIEARGLVDKIVVLLGALIALTVLSTSALQAAMEALRGTENTFVSEYVLVTGLLLSVALGVLVVIATAGMGKWASSIVDATERDVSVSDEGWHWSYLRRCELESYLTRTRDDTFTQLVAILAPFISATGAVAL